MSTLAGAVDGAAAGLARGRARLPADTRMAHQRDRLRRAVIACVAERGFAEVTVADIVAAARVSRATFYELYDSREACLLDAADNAWLQLRQRIETALRDADDGDPRPGLDALMRAYLGFLAGEPEFTWLFEVDLMAAGAAAVQARLAAHRLLARDLARWHRPGVERLGWPAATRQLYLAVVGAIDELVVHQVVAGRTARLTGLLDIAVETTHRLLSVPSVDAEPQPRR